MEGFSSYLGISRTFSLICCMIRIFSPAEGKTITQAVGSRVILHCDNESISALSQLTWKMNGDLLFSFSPPANTHISNKTLSLNMKVSELYALIIETALKSHTGNYTCETTNTVAGAGRVKWELIITEGDNWQTSVDRERWEKIAIAVAVPCVCFLILIISLAILRRVCTKCRKNTIHSPTVGRGQTEDIYENCLETHFNQRRGYDQPHHFKARAH